MLKSKIIVLFLTLTAILSAKAQSTDERYRNYIDRWAPVAVEQQKAYSIPASITLAQGLLESAAGRSTLATEGNNHFGIKCHKDWQGDTMLRNDDAPDECFRVYNTAEESFEDHSRFLCRKRYARLFDLDISDYEGWAKGLRECGYATDPQYAVRLISIIERYSLYVYDTPGGRDAAADALFILQHLQELHPVRRARGMHYVIANPGDKYSDIAREFKVKTKRLLEYNDAEHDSEIREWQEVWLEPKSDSAPEGVTRATIGEDETMHSVSQRYGMKISVLQRLNPKAEDAPGTVLRLR